MSSNIQSKTIRPGSLRYSYYQSGAKAKQSPAKKTAKRGHFKGVLLILMLIVIAPIAYSAAAGSSNNAGSTSTNNTHNSRAITPVVTKPKPATQTVQSVVTPPNPCASVSSSQLILVSISQQHLWACSGTSEVYNSAVVTGDTQYPDTLTPVGTYHIYAKETDRTLTGSDENGTWHDFVYYWMPFLYNQYGAYGLHDATWRANSAFGNIDPNTANASNGCVELPLTTAKWVYDWASVGTAVTIES